MHVCVLGDLDDLAAAYVAWLARAGGHDVLELAEGALGVRWDYDCGEDGDGILRVGTRRLRWTEVAGVFVRLNPDPPLPEGLSLEEPERSRFVQERREGLHQLLDRLICTVVNRPSAGRSNASKPYQMAELESAGFDVPRWIASNSPAAVARFAREVGGEAVYKAASGLRSRVRMLDQQLGVRLEAGTSPVVVQQYVPGSDVRLHTVGRAAFACQVTGAGVDYRFEHQNATYAPVAAPERLVRRSRPANSITRGGPQLTA
jgi:hypothetical protein